LFITGSVISIFDNSGYEKAIPYYKKAIGEYGLSPIYHCNLGRAFGQLNNWTRMIGYCGKAVELRKQQKEDTYTLDYYYGFLAVAHLRADKVGEFEKNLMEEDDLIGSERAILYNRIANHYFDIADFEKAIPYYKKAIGEHDQAPIYYSNLGRAFGELNDWTLMIEHLGKAVDLRKNQPADAFGLDYYYEFLAVAHFRADKLGEFKKSLKGEDKLKDKERALVYNRIGNLYFDIADYEKAIPYYKKAIGEYDQAPIYHCNLGRAYGYLKKPNRTKMIRHCGKAVDLRKKQPGDAFGLDYYYKYLAESYFRADKLDEFEQKLQAENQLNEGEQAHVYNRIGNLYFDNADFEKAIPYYTKAVKKDDQAPIFYCNLGRAYGHLKKPDRKQMIKHCGKAVELRKMLPGDSYDLDYYYEFLAEAYFRADKLGEFEQRLQAESELKNKERVLVYNRIGNLYSENFDDEKAILYYKKAEQLDLAEVSEIEKPNFASG